MSEPNVRTQPKTRSIVVTLMVVILVLAAAGSAIYFLQRSALKALDQARSDVDGYQSLAAAAGHALQAAQATLDRASMRLNEELFGTGGTGVPGVGAEAGRRQAERDDARAALDDATVSANQRNAQLDTAISVRASAEEAARVWPTAWIAYGILATALLLMLGIWWLYQRSEAIRESEDGVALDRVRQATTEATDGRMASPSLINQTMLQEYHGIVLRSARSSRSLTIATLALGFFLLIVLGTTTVFMVDGVPATIAASVVMSAGAAVTGYTTRAVLRNAENSAREVGLFFDHPRQLELVLAAERVLVEISPERSDEARLEIIRALVTPSVGTKKD